MLLVVFENTNVEYHVVAVSVSRWKIFVFCKNLHQPLFQAEVMKKCYSKKNLYGLLKSNQHTHIVGWLVSTSSDQVYPADGLPGFVQWSRQSTSKMLGPIPYHAIEHHQRKDGFEIPTFRVSTSRFCLHIFHTVGLCKKKKTKKLDPFLWVTLFSKKPTPFFSNPKKQETKYHHPTKTKNKGSFPFTTNLPVCLLCRGSHRCGRPGARRPATNAAIWHSRSLHDGPRCRVWGEGRVVMILVLYFVVELFFSW